MHQGLHTLLVAQPDITVIGEAGNGKEAVERVRAHAPDVVVMDLNMPELNGINATERIVAASPETKVVALSIHAGKPFVDDMLRAGATGCVLKENAPEELVRCIRAVLRGDRYLSTAITGTRVAACENPLPARKMRARHAQELFPAAADKGSPEPILYTRLHRPPMTPDLVVRSQLMEQLNRGRTRPLTLVSAPAGYGKSTLVSSWLDTCHYPSAWLSLDEGDNELSQFLRYLVAAVRCISPAALGHTLLMSAAPSQPPVSVMAVCLTNELDQLEAPIILVLDDYHRIRDAAVHKLLVELLRYPPRPLHLVLATRRDPPLLIDELRARDQITEIRAADLRFTAVETARFLKKASPDQVIDAATAEAWTEKTEGWVTGLRLLVLSLRHDSHAYRQLTEIKYSDRYVSDYLRT
nr:response regulator [Gammaproteobacteria bacterium]